VVKAVKAAQLADQIRDYLAAWTAQDFLGYFFSVTQITLKPDLSVAIVWIDILRPEESKLIMRKLNQRVSVYQHSLQRSLQRRMIPHLEFRLDDREERNQQFDRLLKQ